MRHELVVFTVFLTLLIAGSIYISNNSPITGNIIASYGDYSGYKGAQGINAPGNVNINKIFKDVCEKSNGRWGTTLRGKNTCVCPDVSVRKDGIACEFADLGKCTRTKGIVTEHIGGGKDCDCGQGKIWTEQGCITKYTDLCQTSGGKINVKILPQACECKEGSAWDEKKGCYSLKSTLCTESGGLWTVEGTEVCKCPEDMIIGDSGCQKKKTYEAPLAVKYSSLIQDACKKSGGNLISVLKTRYPAKDAESRNIAIINALDNYCSCPNPFGWSLFQGCVKRTHPANYMSVQCSISGGKWITTDFGELSDYAYESSKQTMYEQRTTTGYCICTGKNQWSLAGSPGCYG